MVMRALQLLARPANFRTIDIDFFNCPGTNQFYPRDRWAHVGVPCAAELAPAIDCDFIEAPAVDAAAMVPDPIYWVFCDGCHCRECVDGEIAAYGPRIAPGGFFICHDCGEEYRDYPPDQEYHGDAARQFGVIEGVTESRILKKEFDLVATSRSRPIREVHHFGGAYFYQRKEQS